MNPEVEKQKLVIESKKGYMKHEKEMEILRHKDIMEEIEAMGKYKITHLERRTKLNKKYGKKPKPNSLIIADKKNPQNP